jgi:hypothetical protein
MVGGLSCDDGCVYQMGFSSVSVGAVRKSALMRRRVVAEKSGNCDAKSVSRSLSTSASRTRTACCVSVEGVNDMIRWINRLECSVFQLYVIHSLHALVNRNE